MVDPKDYTVFSFELHLFFARIMKEHAFFLRAGFLPIHREYRQKAEQFQTRFESLLATAVSAANGVLRPQVLASGELITALTTKAEQKSQSLTGIALGQDMTSKEAKLRGGDGKLPPKAIDEAKRMNRDAKPLLHSFIAFQQNLCDAVQSGRLFTAHYPLFIEHMLQEAILYRQDLERIEEGVEDRNMAETALFWNLAMQEHALFTRGLLDPSENALVGMANDFAFDFGELLETEEGATNTALKAAFNYREFQLAVTRDILKGKIRSAILPLLADHTLREANHYLRLLSRNG